jgi:hypothetical protein
VVRYSAPTAATEWSRKERRKDGMIHLVLVWKNAAVLSKYQMQMYFSPCLTAKKGRHIICVDAFQTFSQQSLRQSDTTRHVLIEIVM